ncbi:uncharacterized protein FOMMEDRAFT_127984 [Fomitiporia mediterranea MF3/22]|uniref:uncharacterized protein n=1 Tax=Fomitiporia mediterranea (strain MF3/22) TaxID=694068 RepID=UPI00044094C4|nr:uncharacterized protein FOMMEDRAFT_127984 [Fomitiporia mediterranea MF3/22]EJC99800.1 hypothetical protein FOMMEDRAFT_127984 [Fomitiporia mediterranea MF3/22]
MLERHGYLLRPRFRPDWIPSWLNTNKSPLLFEDSFFNPMPMIIDAKRMSDGTQVIIKAVERNAKESNIGLYLSSGDHANDSENHCIPFYEIVRDDEAPSLEFIIMPLLRPFNDPPFFSVDEVLDFMQQTLQGLGFMHKLGVAHRDCSDENIMFDAAEMYPKGFHASLWSFDAAGNVARPLRRSDVRSVKYYFTDFGLSSRFKEGEPRLVSGREGLDQDVPELSSFKTYDPFAVDIYILGNVFKRHLTTKFTNIQFLTPLVESMTQQVPEKRPSSADALKQFNELVSDIPGYARRWVLKDVGGGKLTSVIQDAGSVRRECFYILKSLLGSPRRFLFSTARPS